MRNRQITPVDMKLIDFIPALSGLIGKIALVSSFALMWTQSLNITTPGFVFENVRIELIIGSLITLLGALFLPNLAPSGTLAPLVILIPAMAGFGAHPFILSILVGIAGIISIKTKLFHKLISLSGYVSKTALTLTFGVAGVVLSLRNLRTFFTDNYVPLLLIVIILFVIYILLLKRNKAWLVIPTAATVSILIPLLFGVSMDLTVGITLPNFSPFYWWNDMWGIGFGINLLTIIKTLPFALFAIIIWAIDTISINAMMEANYTKDEKKIDIDFDRSFIITSIRNMAGGICGGAQTAALWRSFLIPAFMVKRPLRSASIILGVIGITAGFAAIPVKVLSFPPLIWSVLLFGIFLPFLIVGFKNMIQGKKYHHIIIILLFTMLGVYTSPILTWVGALAYEKIELKITAKK